MALGDLTDPEAVSRAIREFDEIGRDAFLEKYSFGPARDYFLTIRGQRYDSKAIVGAAHGYQHPDLGPLPSTAFSGGNPTVSKLEELGFTVNHAPDSQPPADTATAAMREFLSLYETARGEPFRGDNPAAALLRRVADELRSELPGELSGARVKPSVGQGNWAAVPWIAVLDPRITTTTQHGVYPVVLIPEDLRGVYVTLAQGVTDLKRAHGLKDAYVRMRGRADTLRPELTDLEEAGFDDTPIDLGASTLGRDYAASTIVAKYLTTDALVEDDFERAVRAANEAYARLLDAGMLHAEADEVQREEMPRVLGIYIGENGRANFESGGRRGWWGWKEPPGDKEPVRVGDLVAFASGFTGGSPRVKEDQWQEASLRGLVVGRVDQPPARNDEPVMPDEVSGDASWPWKFRFTILGEHADVSLEPGVNVSGPVAEAFRVSAIDRGRGRVAPIEGSPLLETYLNGAGTPQPGGPTLAATADAFASAVEQSGLQLARSRTNAFFASALAKPFVILTGQSGSGKTQLAMRLGEWCGHDASGRPRYLVVPVRPDWTGPEFLFGYPDALAPPIDDRVVWAVPDTLAFLLRAHHDETAPYVLVLDEMNLAHVERYFADFLSGIESREPVLPNLEQQDGTWSEAIDGGKVPLPSNLIVVGTVNVDETTYMFSPKVLDRAFAHEFRVTADQLTAEIRRPSPVQPADELELRTVVDVLRDDDWHFTHRHPDEAALVEELRGLHSSLGVANLDFGHRVAFEALRYASFLNAIGVTGIDDVLDLIVMTKLLPKIHGSRQRLESTLRVLEVWATGSDEGNGPQRPLSAAKLHRMLEILVDAQFVTFTE